MVECLPKRDVSPMLDPWTRTNFSTAKLSLWETCMGFPCRFILLTGGCFSFISTLQLLPTITLYAGCQCSRTYLEALVTRYFNWEYGFDAIYRSRKKHQDDNALPDCQLPPLVMSAHHIQWASLRMCLWQFLYSQFLTCFLITTHIHLHIVDVLTLTAVLFYQLSSSFALS